MEQLIGMIFLGLFFWALSKMGGPARPTYELPRKYRRRHRRRR